MPASLSCIIFLAAVFLKRIFDEISEYNVRFLFCSKGRECMAKKKDGPAAAAWRVLGLMTNVGITLAASVLIGYYMGHYLDKWLLHRTDSWFTIIFALFGIAAGFRVIFRMLNQSLDGGGKE